VSDKTGLVALASQLVHAHGMELVASGGTATTLRAAGLHVRNERGYAYINVCVYV
jgi:phosphoribosylaminoimidazolecarboxamide formyltransferase/IMP cyclohydrolase